MVEVTDIVNSLLSPAAYPEPVSRIELIQTGISLVFLTDDFAYKVKKTVKYDYLDFSTPEKRLYYCNREVILNRRLCPDVYLGVVDITDNMGAIRIGGRGKVIEHAVKMVRLPQKDMMDVRLRNGSVTPEMVERIALKLAQFHSGAETSKEIGTYGSLSLITGNADENFAETVKCIGITIPENYYKNIKNYTEKFIEDNARLFEKRTEEGRIRDCHGDLHARNICIGKDICIYDCIEFNDRFRYSDVASEVAFLAMDLDHFGRADLSRVFVNEYIKESHDTELKKLLDFYKCYRAYVRGKIESFQLDDPLLPPEEKEHTRDKARSYFDLAMSYTKPGPLLMITAGLTGTGKSTAGRVLASRLGMTVISSDTVRKNLAAIPQTEHRYVPFGNDIYSPEFTRKTYDTLFAQAKDILSEGGKVLLDASFIKEEQRVTAKKLAEEMNVDFFILEFRLDEQNIRKRLLERKSQQTVSDGRWEIYLGQKKDFDRINEKDWENHIVVDAAKPVDVITEKIIDEIFSKI